MNIREEEKLICVSCNEPIENENNTSSFCSVECEENYRKYGLTDN